MSDGMFQIFIEIFKSLMYSQDLVCVFQLPRNILNLESLSKIPKIWNLVCYFISSQTPCDLKKKSMYLSNEGNTMA